MPLRSEIPQGLQLQQGRDFKYRVRTAWGSNHLRRRDAKGNLLRTVVTRSNAAGRTIAPAIDGYRPHTDPLNSGYAGWWESSVRPLIARQYSNLLPTSGYADQLFADDFTDTNGTLLAAHTIAPRNNTYAAWLDPNSRWQINTNAVIRNGAGQGDASSSIDLGISEYDLFFSLYVDSAASYNAGMNIRLKDYQNLFYLRFHSDDAGRVDLIKVLRGANYGSVASSTAWTISVGWKSVLVKVRRTGIKVWVDGVLYLNYASTTLCNVTKIGFDCAPTCSPKWDSLQVWRPLRFYESFADWSNWSLGAFGPYTSQSASLAGKWGKLTAQNTNVPYSENFESYPVDELMTTHNWANYNHDAVGQYFKVVTGKYGKCSAYGTGGAWSTWRYEGTGALSWADYTVEFDVKATAGGRFNFCVRYTSGGCYTVQGLPGVANELKLWHSNGNNPIGTYVSTLASATCPGTVNHVSINVTGNRIRVTIDGNTLIDYTDASNLHPVGSVGVMAYANGWTLDNLVMTPNLAAAGYTGLLNFDRLTKCPISRDSVFQFQIGIKKTTPAGSYWAESGVSMSDVSSSDISADQNALHVVIRNSAAGTKLVTRKVVAGVTTVLRTQALGVNDYSESVRVVFRYDPDFGPVYEVWAQKYGMVSAGTCSWMPELIKAKAFVQATDYANTVEGFFRDFGVFPSRRITVTGEVGFYDDFQTFTEHAWERSTRGGFATTMSVETVDALPALFVRSAGAEWCFASQIADTTTGDWVFEGSYKQGARVGIWFCLQDPDPDNAKGYAVQFETGTCRFVKDTSDNGAGWVTTLKTRADILTAADEVFTVKIIKQGTRFMVYKNDALIFDVTDASYTSGLFAYQSYNTTGFYCFWHKMSPRGLQQPVQLRIDRPMLQNASFEDWDDQDGLTYDIGTVPNSWKAAMSASGTSSRSADGVDGNCVKIGVTSPQSDPYLQNEIYQRNVRFLQNHRYRMSCQVKLENLTPDDNNPIFSEECQDVNNWTDDGWSANRTLSPDGEAIRFSLPSSPPGHSSAIREVGVIDVTKNPKVRINVPEVTGTIQWKLGVATGLPDISGAGIIWLNDYVSSTGVSTFDLVDAGLSGPQYLFFVLWFTGTYSTSDYVAVDYLRVLPYGGLIQGYPFFYLKAMTNGNQPLGRHMVQIASPTENVLAADQWQQVSFDFVADVNWSAADTNYVTAMVSCEYPNQSNHKPVGDFAIYVDQVLIEDITGFTVGEEPALEWTTTPVSYRGRESDRDDPADYWKASYTMPLNIIWRIGESFTWGLLDENYADLFTSRLYSDILPGSEWKLTPEWIACDLGVLLTLNQVVFYPYYQNGIRSLLVTSGGPVFSDHVATMVMQGLTSYSSSLRLDVELPDDIETRYCQVVVLDTDAEGNTATCQQVELYNFSDETTHVNHSADGAPDVSITQSRPADKLNSLPNAATCTLSVINDDERYTPSNKYSPIYGPYKQADGLGDIRSGAPLRISMLASDFIAGSTRYAQKDDCFGDGYWQSSGFSDNYLNPGFIRLTPPSSSGDQYKRRQTPITVNVDNYNKIRFGIAAAFSPEYYPDPDSSARWFKWRLGVLVCEPGGDPDAATPYYFTDPILPSAGADEHGDPVEYHPGVLGDYAFDIDTLGITGEKMLQPFVEFDYQGDGVPVAYTFWVTLDYCYIYADIPDSRTQYETLMFMGSVGVDKNNGASMGVSIDGAARMGTIDAVDTTVVLDQPVPVDVLNPLETYTAEDTMRTLCYLAGIPYQDMTFDVTGVTFPVVVFRDQTMRENIQQLVQAIGGKFYTTRDGRLRYQNVAVNRSWTLTERQEFEGGTKSLVDTQTVQGEFYADNVAWDINHIFSVYPENQSNAPWTMNRTDSFRFLSGGEYVVMTPAGQNSAMQHIRKGAYNKTKGFTLEYDVDLASQALYFDVWGYTDDVVGYTTAACAWRLRLYKYGSALYMAAGGQTQWWGMTDALYSEGVTCYIQNSRVRVRITVSGTNYSVYINDQLWRTVPLTTPKLIRWGAYESSSEYDDDFAPARAGHLNGSTGQKNTTGDTWHDPNNRWWRDYSGYLRPGASSSDYGSNDDRTTYLNFGCPDYRFKGKIYLDRSNAREGGWFIKYIDSANWIAVRIVSTPDPGNPNRIIVSVFLTRMIGGVLAVLAEAPTQYYVYEGSQYFCFDVSSFGVRVYMQAYNPYEIWNAQWHQLLYYGFDWNSLGASLCGSTKFGPYAKQGTDGRISWDDIEVDYGSGSYLGAGDPIDYVIGNTHYYTNAAIIVYTASSWYPAPTDDYSGKIVIGPDPAREAQLTTSNYPNWQLGTYQPGYRLAYFRQKMTGAIAPIGDGRNGYLVSPRHLCGSVATWGIFEAEISGIGQKLFNGLLDQVSNVDFFVQVSNDGNTWDAWVKVTPGQMIPTTVALKTYIRWKAEFWKNRALLDQWLSPNMFCVYWKAHVKSVTANWQISPAVTADTFRATWNIKADTTEGITGLETNAGQYSLGNPLANRVTVLVNRWVEQAITDIGTGDPFWSSSELPTILNAGEVYVIDAKYAYPSKKGSGGTLRHCHVDVNGSVYAVNDGAGNTTCGNATVRFDSGQGVGTITITGNAANTVINSAKIDAVCYKPASDLYGTEQVSVEDEASQNLLGRIIETDTFDNAFAMSRDIASDYATAELTRTKQFKESIIGVQIPLLPTLSLEQYGIIHNPIMGVYERQVAPTEITHQGFVTLISAEGVRTNEETEDFAPLDLSLTGAFATHRLAGCASDYILKIRDAITGNEFEVYDCCQYFPYFQTEEDGEWIDGTDMELYVSAIYDQTGNSRDLLQTTEAYQPRILFEIKNGFPAISFDGSDDFLTSTGKTLADFITNTDALVLAGANVTGEPVDVASPDNFWKLPKLFANEGINIGLMFGTYDSGADLATAYNYHAGEDMAQTSFTREAWAIYGFRHSATVALAVLIDGEEKDAAATGTTNDLTTAFNLGGTATHPGYFTGLFDIMFTAAGAMTDAEMEKLTGYIQAH